MAISKPDSMLMRRQPQQKRSQQRVEKILKVAAEVFAEVGYEAATTHQIAAKADTAIGSLYQFFPDKLAIFHALEAIHMERVRAILTKLMQSADEYKSLREFIEHTVDIYAQYFEDPIPRVVYIQYFVAPELFELFDETFDKQLIQQFAAFFRQWNPDLAIEKSELLAETVHRTYNALLLNALKQDQSKRQVLYAELKTMLVSYLMPYTLSQQVMKVMICPHCNSSRLSKNGHRHDKQRYLCKDCGKQFLERLISENF
ncbi:TetR family transcriptional regulator protein (plasmid) [Anabaenopsis circularis NIES-21]|uniref:TetR family transcriptional regulator protein n=1 Tax=Anabaenopsis circularis NIES-21 TaxID=1085406 RepID=A0A1Z4GSB1_9CYAN|nr:TetR family transcriptional regulator protein [Anabaenopsis circularis NIES-21]